MNTEQSNKYLDGFQINDRSIYDNKDNEYPLDCLLEDYHQEQLKLFSIHIVSKSVAVEYAEFCVRCDREKLPLLCLEDYIKQYCC